MAATLLSLLRKGMVSAKVDKGRTAAASGPSLRRRRGG
jgi:hypothetical protein